MPGRVLLIEDEPNIIEAISFILSRDGWTVHTHEDGETAMDKVLAMPPDMIILDVMLPGRSGFDILRDLRGHSGYQGDGLLRTQFYGEEDEGVQTDD